MKVSFLGLGIMGSRMALNLAKNNIDLTVFNRTVGKTSQLEDAGAKVVSSVQEAVQDADIVITMLSTPQVASDLAYGEGGFLKHMKKNALWMDSTTVSPADTRSSYHQANQAGIRFLETPVAGTKQPAEQGELIFFVGGEKTDIESVSHLLEIMGKKTIHLGEPGKAASLKILVNLMLAQSMLAFSETVNLGTKLGLDQSMLMDVLLSTPVTAPFLQNVRPKLESKDTTPNFPLQWMHKDLHLVAEAAYESEASVPSASIAKEVFGMAKAQGLGEQDFSIIFHFLAGNQGH